MSIQPAALHAWSGTGEPAALATRMPTGDGVARIREQAADIIEEVLSGTDPGQAAARQALREQCAAHPGHPETALAEHVLTIRGITLGPARCRTPLLPVSTRGAGGVR